MTPIKRKNPNLIRIRVSSSYVMDRIRKPIFSIRIQKFAFSIRVGISEPPLPSRVHPSIFVIFSKITVVIDGTSQLFFIEKFRKLRIL